MSSMIDDGLRGQKEEQPFEFSGRMPTICPIPKFSPTKPKGASGEKPMLCQTWSSNKNISERSQC